MNASIESLHGILKDKTRRKIVLLLGEKESLSYTDLMKLLNISSTGKLNYHLKILNNLLEKRENGQYVLTAKGTAALRLLLESDEKKSQSEIEASFPRAFYIIVGLFAAAFLGIAFAFFLSGTIDLNRFLMYIITDCLGVAFLVAAERARVKRAEWAPKRQMIGAEITLIAVGALAGAITCFFGVGLILVALHNAGVPIWLSSFTFFIAVSFTTGAILGALLGYLIYRKSKFSKIRYYDPFAD